jgi:hypothetical protein
VRDLSDTHVVAIAIEIDANESEVPAELRRNAEHFLEVLRSRNDLVGAGIFDRKRLLVPRCIEVLALVPDVTVDIDLDELRRPVQAKDLVVLKVPVAEQYRLDDHFRLEQLVVRLAPGSVVVDVKPALDQSTIDRLALFAQDHAAAGVRRLDAALRRKLVCVDGGFALDHIERRNDVRISDYSSHI